MSTTPTNVDQQPSAPIEGPIPTNTAAAQQQLGSGEHPVPAVVVAQEGVPLSGQEEVILAQ